MKPETVKFLRKWIQIVFMGLASLMNILLPVVKEVHDSSIDNSYVLGFNIVASLCIILSIRSKDIADLIVSIADDVGGLKSDVNSMGGGTARLSIPMNVPDREPDRDDEDNEPVQKDTNIVPMNAYYDKVNGTYEITPRPGNNKKSEHRV